MTQPEAPKSEFVLYLSEDGRTRIQCRFEDQSLWLTQAQLAELFQTSVPNINLHLKAIFEEGERALAATLKSHSIVRQTEANAGDDARGGSPAFTPGPPTKISANTLQPNLFARSPSLVSPDPDATRERPRPSPPWARAATARATSRLLRGRPRFRLAGANPGPPPGVPS